LRSGFGEKKKEGGTHFCCRQGGKRVGAGEGVKVGIDFSKIGSHEKKRTGDQSVSCLIQGKRNGGERPVRSKGAGKEEYPPIPGFERGQ